MTGIQRDEIVAEIRRSARDEHGLSDDLIDALPLREMVDLMVSAIDLAVIETIWRLDTT